MSSDLPSDIPNFLKPGSETCIGSFTFSEQLILDFARQFDPQRFHIDREQATASVLGGLCASGWQTVSIWMKLQRQSVAELTEDLKLNNLAWPEFGPSPGMKNLKWIKPVYVNQTIAYINHIEELRRSRSRQGWWLMTNHARAENQAGERVMQFESAVFLKIHGLTH